MRKWSEERAMKLSDRQKQTVEKLKGIDSGNEFFWDDKTGTAKFIKGRLSKPSNDEPETIARAFLEDNSRHVLIRLGGSR
jgi:hypothetical protein